MKIIEDIDSVPRRPYAMTIGKFDGVHAGHMALLKKTVEYGKNLGIQSLVFTFRPNPAEVLSGKPFTPLISEREKAGVLSGIGIDILLNYPFDRQFADITPEEFMKLIFEDLECRALAVGDSFRFGKGRKGDGSMLSRAGRAYGAVVEIVRHIDIDGEPVSSSRIREAISRKDYALAQRLLGRSVEGIQA